MVKCKYKINYVKSNESWLLFVFLKSNFANVFFSNNLESIILHQFPL